MKKMTSKELRDLWLTFYENRGHVNIGSVSLLADGTTGVLFNVAGMQPLMPYLLGKKHKDGKRLCNIQGCVRTNDIESVGDSSHVTFFEMMGSWSLGDYFKEERTKWSYEILTQLFDFPREKIAATVFEGNEFVKRDEESAYFREKSGILRENIYYLPKNDNWWELERGPCGPDSELFYITDKKPCGPNCKPGCSCGRFVEVGNDVFMQYERIADNKYIPLKQKNVDTGWGLERILQFLNDTGDVYLTDLFIPVIKKIEELSGKVYDKNQPYVKSMRILADHIRTSTMLIGDVNGIIPNNTGAGYILRRLIRRAVRYARELNIESKNIITLSEIFIDEVYYDSYPSLSKNKEYIKTVLQNEINKFEKTLNLGLKEFEKVIEKLNRKNQFMKEKDENYQISLEIDGKNSFRLFDTFGFPLEFTEEMAKERDFIVDKEGFWKIYKEHQEKSRCIGRGEFASGLQNNTEKTIKYHTATHLLNAALKFVIGSECHQKGSNITEERLRFDFPSDHKLTQDEIQKIEELINEWIAQKLPVSFEKMSKYKAVEIGAEHQFIDRYPDDVTVYKIGDVSKEICAGPHVKNLGELTKFKIVKEESVSQGVRRIKAILE